MRWGQAEMSGRRLSLALEAGLLELPHEGRIAVFGPNSLEDVDGLPKERSFIVQPVKPLFDVFSKAGFDCGTAAEGAFSLSIVFMPRAKALARLRVAEAVALSDDVIVDGQKTDGIDSMLKACKSRTSIDGSFSKAHGKLFWFSGGDFEDWLGQGNTQLSEGFETAPGVFSADGIDPASRALVSALPDNLGVNVADLGAGWGFLSRSILERSGIETLYMVEADHAALECAKLNVKDDRAEFHWADATTWEPRAKMNAVVMNPPFHTGRAAEPDLGRAFIKAAARMLAPRGQLWMVANRHLPYETTLAECFLSHSEVAGDNRFKILHAERPARVAR